MTAGGEPTDAERLLRDATAMLDGHFQLTSGKHSSLYIEKFRLLEQPAQTEALCRMIADWARPFLPELIAGPATGGIIDRKSTRLNSSHPSISYAVFCLKKKNIA